MIDSAILIGYWYSHYSPEYPHPSEFIVSNYSDNKIVDYLNSGYKCNYFRGSSGCRICKCGNGCYEITDGTYIWPVGLAHYVEYHNVKLPDVFLNHIISKEYKIPVMNGFDNRTIIKPDFSLWNNYIVKGRKPTDLQKYSIGYAGKDINWIYDFLKYKGFNISVDEIKAIQDKGIYSI